MTAAAILFHMLNLFVVIDYKDMNFCRISGTPQGTGSYPDPPQGWQRRMRFSDSQNPLNGPYFRKASRAYWEHVGVNRQVGGLSGEMHS